jgi:hypothetical protein
MAFNTIANSPLTSTQIELTSKISSMKSLLALPFQKQNNIPKNRQISTFDYLKLILTSIGINPDILMQAFVFKVFDLTNTFLEDVVVDAIGASLDAKGIKLSKDLSNASVLRSQLAALNRSNFLVTAKLAIAKELTYMIFGPKNGASSASLVPDQTRRNFLFGEAICGYNMFTLSNNPSIRNEDIEYNRVQLKTQLESGQVTFQISCQDVKIGLPVDPGYIFGEGGPNTVTSRPVTPGQSLDVLVTYVNNSVGRINNQQNANKAGSTFYEIMITRLISYITTLTIPYLGPIFGILYNIGTDINGNNLSQFNPENTLYGSCAIGSDPVPEKTAYSKSLMNALYKELVKGMLLFAITQFKKLISAYFARTAQERARRKANKIKQRFNLFKNIPDPSKVAQLAQSLSTLKSILGTV